MTRCLSPRARRTTALAAAVSLLAILQSCSDHTTGPAQGRRTADLHFLRVKAGAPALAATTVSFYAKRGEDRSGALYYSAAAGARDSAKLLDFQVPAGALLSRPDGSAYAPGDSVLIRISVVDPVHMILAFEPSGIRFSPDSPARLEFSFAEANDDLNDDGSVDAQDDALRAQLSFWVQETSGGLWTKLQTTLILDLREADGSIDGFSGYALAY